MGGKTQFQMEVDAEDEGLGVPLLRVGERVRGRVEARTDGSVAIQGLTVDLLWQGHGKGSPESHEVDFVTAAPGADGTWATSFDLKVPETGPLSYEGENVKISWYLRARTRTSWGDGEDSEKYPLLVMPASEAGAGEDPGTHRHEQSGSPAWFFIIFGLLFGGIPGFMALVFLSEGEYIPVLFLSLFMLIGGGLFLAGVSQLMAGRLFQDAFLETPRADTMLGERVPFRVGGVARTAFQLDRLVVKHVCIESATRQRGTNSTTYTKELHVQEVTFEPGRTYQPGEAFEFTGEFRMPEDAPATLDGTRNDITWKFLASFDVPRWPDPGLEWRVPMRPVLAAEVFEGQQEAGA